MSFDSCSGDVTNVSDAVAVSLSNVGKCFNIYDKPHHRLMQGLYRGRKKFYKEFWALHDVSFEIYKGETVGIIGKNGAGKSTLLQILAGTLMPTVGDFSINGRVTALLELGAGFNPEFTGVENIFLNSAIYGLATEEIEKKFDEIVAFADIGEFINQPVKTYSSGMYVRLAFAIQASLEPDIFIVDEALAVGDAGFVHKCMSRFHELKENGATILLVTHDATAVRTLCERAIWLDKGGVALDGKPVLVVDEYLADLSNQPICVDNKNLRQTDGELSEEKLQESGGIESVLPNIGSRYGDQVCSIIGASLYDANKKKVNIVFSDSEVIIRVSFKNRDLEEGSSLTVGYVLRNSRGVDIASSNSEIERCEILAPAPGCVCTVNIVVSLPLLHPGSYAFTVSINYYDKTGVSNNADALPNLIVFDVVSKKQVHVLMSLRSRFTVE